MKGFGVMGGDGQPNGVFWDSGEGKTMQCFGVMGGDGQRNGVVWGQGRGYDNKMVLA